MSEISYVDAYRRLDADATSAETQAEQYRKRADHDRWEQCRIAHEAVTEGGYTRAAFADAVGKNASEIGYQVRIWADHLGRALEDRPPYPEAYNTVKGRPGGPDSTAHRGRQIVRNLPAADKAKLAAELVDDPEVVDAMARQPETRRTVSRAAGEAAAAALPDPGYQRPAPSGGGLAGIHAELTVGELIRKARFAIRDAIEQARDATFDEDAASLLIEDLGRLRAGADHLESAIMSDAADFDAALADLVKGDES